MHQVQPNAKVSDGKKAWVTPAIRRIRAGDAEAGFAGAREDAPFAQSS